jgi:hypothetical protein
MIKAKELASLEKACSNYHMSIYAVIKELEKTLITNALFPNSSKGYDLYIPKKLYGTFKKPSWFTRDLTQYLCEHGYTVSYKKKYYKLDSIDIIHVLRSIKYWPYMDINNDTFVILTIEW